MPSLEGLYGSLYGVQLEGGAVYYVCEDPKDDTVVVRKRKRGGVAKLEAARQLCLSKECTGIAVGKVAFERRPGKPAAIKVVHSGNRLLECLTRSDTLREGAPPP